jgi:hypothetical protein
MLNVTLSSTAVAAPTRELGADLFMVTILLILPL